MEDIELQLLCVVMGDAVVIKVERGRLAAGELVVGVHSFYPMDEGAVRLVQYPFSVVRAAIDALEEKPPVPRIELSSTIGKGLETYRLFKSEMWTQTQVLTRWDYDTLSQLAGKPLPIWTPTKGEWKCLLKAGMWPMPTDIDVEIWRYTRRKV